MDSGKKILHIGKSPEQPTADKYTQPGENMETTKQHTVDTKNYGPVKRNLRQREYQNRIQKAKDH